MARNRLWHGIVCGTESFVALGLRSQGTKRSAGETADPLGLEKSVLLNFLRQNFAPLATNESGDHSQGYALRKKTNGSVAQ
jgi:hypothetical protein